MTREENAKLLQEHHPDWTKEVAMAELDDFSDEIIEKGYDIFDFDCTGMLEICPVYALEQFDSDEAAVEQAAKDGVKFIPVNELPESFERRYLGWIDTPENRRAIEEYCSQSR